jgi:hypothetical protein
VGNRLGLTFPKAVFLPERLSIEEIDGLVSQSYLDHVAEELDLPFILKPYDGYA